MKCTRAQSSRAQGRILRFFNATIKKIFSILLFVTAIPAAVFATASIQNLITTAPNALPGQNITITFQFKSTNTGCKVAYFAALSNQCAIQSAGTAGQAILVNETGINVACCAAQVNGGRTSQCNADGNWHNSTDASCGMESGGGAIYMTVPAAWADGNYYAIVCVRDCNIYANPGVSDDQQMCVAFTVGPYLSPTPTFTSTPSNMIVNYAGATNGGVATAVVLIASPVTSPSITPTFTWTPTATNTPSPTDTYTQTYTYTYTYTATPTNTQTDTMTMTPTYTESPTSTNSPTQTDTLSPSDTPTQTVTYTSTYTATPTSTITDTATITPTYTDSPVLSPTDTPTDTPTFTVTDTDTDTPTFTFTDTQTSTYTATPTFTITNTQTDTPTITFTDTDTPTYTATPTITDTMTITPTATISETVIPYTFIMNIGIYNEAGELVKTIANTESTGMPNEMDVTANSTPTNVVAQNSGTPIDITLPGIYAADSTAKGGGAQYQWYGTNDGGQNVADGVYYIRETTTDQFGHTNIITKEITVITDNQYVMINIFNSAGEIVNSFDEPYDGVSYVYLSITSKTEGSGAFLVGSTAQPIILEYCSSETPASWSGTDSQGNYLNSGVYEVQLVLMSNSSMNPKISKTIELLYEGSQSDTLAGIKAYPNPYIGEGKNTMNFAWTASQNGGYIVIKIYNIAGELVRTLTGNLGDGSLTWDFMGSGNQIVASGTYICVAYGVDGAGNKKTKIVKISVIITK